MNKVYDIHEILQSLSPGFSMRDMLLLMSNYFLEADGNSVKLIPAHNSLPGVSHITIELPQAFGHFGLSVQRLTIHAADGFDADYIMPDGMDFGCAKAACTLTDDEGNEQIRIDIA